MNHGTVQPEAGNQWPGSSSFTLPLIQMEAQTVCVRLKMFIWVMENKTGYLI